MVVRRLENVMIVKYRLHPALAFRRYREFVMVADPRSRRVFRMNAVAGDILNILDLGQDIKDTETLAFVRTLEEQGLLDGSLAIAASAQKLTAATAVGTAGTLARFSDWALEKQVPISCQLELTWRCPLDCRHCYVDHAGLPANEELTTAEVLSLLDDLADMGCMYLALTGGEPFMRRDLRTIYDHARKRRFAVSLLTAGYGIDETLLMHMIRNGLDEVQVSLHGPDASVHDAFTRVTGSFDAAWRTLQLLRDAGVSLRAAISVTRHNVDHIDSLMSMLEAEGIAGNLNLLMAPSRGGGDNRALQIGNDDLQRLSQRYLSPQPGRMAALQPGDAVCGAGRNQMSVGPDGRVQPCLMWPLTVGNIRQTPLKEIWRSSPHLRTVRSMTFENLENCPSCDVRETCNRCTALAVLGDRAMYQHSLLDCMQAKALYYSRNKGEET